MEVVDYPKVDVEMVIEVHDKMMVMDRHDRC